MYFVVCNGDVDMIKMFIEIVKFNFEGISNEGSIFLY